jgi:cytochrome b561
MRLRNGEHGYGVVTKALHWSTVLAIGAQFVVGYTMDDDGKDECDPVGEDRSGGVTSEAEEERLDRLEDQCEAEQDRLDAASDDPFGAWSDLWSGDLFGGGLSLPEVHVLLGVLILALGVLRVAWRRTTPLPPWDARLRPVHQRVVHATEAALLTLQFVIPVSGLLLVLADGDLLTLHIAAHIAFFVALAAHLGMVVGKGLVPRMLPWGRPRSPSSTP